MFVDSEYNYGEVERFFDKHIRKYFEDMSIYDTFANKHPTVSSTSHCASLFVLLTCIILPRPS